MSRSCADLPSIDCATVKEKHATDMTHLGVLGDYFFQGPKWKPLPRLLDFFDGNIFFQGPLDFFPRHFFFEGPAPLGRGPLTRNTGTYIYIYIYMAAAQNVRSGSSPGPTNDPGL